MISLPETEASCGSFVEVLQQRARLDGAGRAYTFLPDGEDEELHLTYAALDRRARAIAVRLRSVCAAGDRALLLYPPGLDFIAGFLGCLYAGVVAVPAYPPDPMRLARSLPRFQAIAADAQVTVVLTTAALLEMGEALTPLAPDLAALRWLSSDEVPLEAADAFCPPQAGPGSLAFLQYTSGSTGAPKGVMVTHGNLLHNSSSIHRMAQNSSRSCCVSWLPCYHDMGLIGGILQPLFGGFPGVLMSPLAFLQRPDRWLRAISRYRATISPFPNFALDLCVRKVSPEVKDTLDLSSWRVAINGAEPVRAESLARFSEAFAPCGFRHQTHYPAYGLAEATLIASGGTPEAAPRLLQIDSRELERQRVVRSPAGAPATRTLTSCGRTLLGQRLLIVDPEARTKVPAGRSGEIWLQGPSVAQGYWGRPEESEATFGARLEGEPAERFLRTGDLGFIDGDELFVAGRQKDVIIVRGRNVYAEDIEPAALGAHRAVRPGCAVAFAVPGHGEEAAAVAVELDPQTEEGTYGAIVSAIRAAVGRRCALEVHAVLLLGPGAIPKTSSGKVMRAACSAAWREGQLEPLAESFLSVPASVARRALTRAGLTALDAPARGAALEAYVCDHVAATFDLPSSAVGADFAIDSLDADSLKLAELQAAVEAELGLQLPLDLVFRGTTPAELAAALLAQFASARSS